MSDDSIKWPYMFRLTDGYESSMPTFKQAMAAMLYEMQEQQQPNGVITICCQTGESKKEMIVATVSINHALADHILPLGTDNIAELMTSCKEMQ